MVVEYAQKTRRAAAMLNIGLAFFIRGGKKYARLLLDEACDIRRDARSQPRSLSMRAYASREPWRAWIAFTVGVKAMSLGYGCV